MASSVHLTEVYNHPIPTILPAILLSQKLLGTQLPEFKYSMQEVLFILEIIGGKHVLPCTSEVLNLVFGINFTLSNEL